MVTPPDDIPQEPQVSGNCCWWDQPTPPREDWVVWLEGVEAEEGPPPPVRRELKLAERSLEPRLKRVRNMPSEEVAFLG